ncbi:MAG: polysaccharide biosynthesis protein [Clostridiales bacterium]|jgi:stage V sporulation protein B|nr:polysaccharide biosynthesis protein [Clostridiales bacterium]
MQSRTKDEQINKPQSFVKQAALLASAALLVRVIGFIYKLPLTNMIGDAGQGIYAAGYQVYNFLLILSSAGLPAAISKMVSERIALKQYGNAHRVFRISLAAAAAAGAFFSILLWALSAHIANAVKNPDSQATLLTLAPTIFLVAVMSVFRGYFQGLNNSVPTALSQLVEQIINAVFSVLLAYYFMKWWDGDVALGAAGGTAGTGLGALSGLIVMCLVYKLNRPRIYKRINAQKQQAHEVIRFDGRRKIIVELLKTAFPIIAGAAIFSFTNLVDMQMVMKRLTEAAGFSDREALALYGQLSNKYVSISTLPVAISSAMATASIPSIAASNVLKQKAAVIKKTNTALRLAMSVSIPAAAGLFVLPDQILLMLFKHYPDGGLLLRIGSISVVFLALAQISTGMLQGIGKIYVPAIAAAAGVLVKIPINYILLGDPRINVAGAVVGTICCYAVSSIIDLSSLTKATGATLDFAGILIKPALASLFMSLVCYVCYYTLYFYTKANTPCVLTAIAASVFSYGAAMLYLGGLRESDIKTMPMGKKALSLLGKMGLSGCLKR